MTEQFLVFCLLLLLYLLDLLFLLDLLYFPSRTGTGLVESRGHGVEVAYGFRLTGATRNPASTCPYLKISFVGTSVRTDNRMGTNRGEAAVHVIAQCTTRSRLVDRAATGLEWSQWCWWFALVGELVTAIPFFATVPVVPVA